MPAGLICAFEACRKPVAAPEEGKKVEVHRVGGELVPFGPGMEAGTVAQATGPLVRVYHGVCYWRLVKRERLLAARVADPSGQTSHAGWRERETCDVEDLRGELGRGAGGAGAAPA
jgi:hypothetical protein